MDARTQRMAYYSNPPNAESHVEEGRKRYRAGCRCAPCKAAWDEYNRIRRRVQREIPEPTWDGGYVYPVSRDA